MYSVTEEKFHEFVDLALETIPPNFKEKMDNLIFLVEDYPTPSDLERLKLQDGRMLLGLYSGTPYTHRSTWYGNTVPDRIILFHKNIESLCYNEAELREKIREVMVHEIAHYFGMNEDEVRKAGY
jgi:predicted Zn-dependent protease with MMP-like domain